MQAGRLNIAISASDLCYHAIFSNRTKNNNNNMDEQKQQQNNFLFKIIKTFKDAIINNIMISGCNTHELHNYNATYLLLSELSYSYHYLSLYTVIIKMKKKSSISLMMHYGNLCCNNI